jgi:hypothetical protein
MSVAVATPINNNDVTVSDQFARGDVRQTCESINRVTPLGSNSYANALNSNIAVPATTQWGPGTYSLLSHRVGGSSNNPIGNPGIPTAMLQLLAGIAGDARSPTNAVRRRIWISIASAKLYSSMRCSRASGWLNPALGNVVLNAFERGVNAIESTGTAEDFVGILRPTAEIKFLSIVGGASGFTVHGLTGTSTTPPSSVTVPSSLSLLGLGLVGMIRLRRRNP